MNKLILTLLLVLCSINSIKGVTISDYDPSHKDSIIEISFHDPKLFFCMYMPEAESVNKQEMLAACDDPLKYKKILLDNNKVVGFAIYFKTQEQSLDSIKRALGNLPCNEEQLFAAMPNLKRTDAECEKFIFLESLAISKDYRGKGHGRMIIKDIFEDCKKKWPEIHRIILNVNANNAVARKLYESEGFIVSKNQPMSFMGIIQYEKKLE